MSAGRARGDRRSPGWAWLIGVLLLLGGAFLAVSLLVTPPRPPARGPGAVPANTEVRQPEAPSTLRRLWRGITGGPAVPGAEVVASESDGGPSEDPVPETPLTIRVLGPDAPVPAEGATVFLDETPLGVTDANGEVTIPYPVDGKRHDAWAEKGHAKAEAFFLREQNLPAGRLTLVLRGTGNVRGLVLDAAGEPVVGADLSLRPTAANPQSSGPQGAFDFGALPEGGYEIVARAPNGAATVWANVTAGTSQEVVLTLEPARRLAGIVVDAAGAPLPGLQVDGRGIVREALPQKTITDAAGRFDLLATDDGRVAVHVRGDGRIGEYEGPPRDDLRIVAHRGAVVILIARRPDGSPVEQASFFLTSVDEDTNQRRWSSAAPIDPVEQPGRFRAEELQPGTWEVAEAGARAGPRRKLATFSIAAGEEKEVELELTAGTRRVSGRVIAQGSREPIAGASLRLGRAPWEVEFYEAEIHTRGTLTDSEGRFSFEQVDEEDRTLKISADGYRATIQQVKKDEGIVVTLLGSRRVRGKVVDEKSLPLMEFFLDRKHIEGSDGIFDEEIDASAEKVIIGGYGRAEVTRTFDANSGDVDLGEIMLSAAKPIRIRVLDPTGAPAVGAQVTVRGSGGRWGRFFNSPGTDREGWVQMIMPPGSYEFTASHPLHARSTEEVSRDITGGESLELRLSPAAWVFGRAGGPGRLVTAQPEGLRTRSAADGSYRVGPISLKRVHLSLEVPEPGGGTRTHQTPIFAVKPGEERRYDFDDPAFGSVLVHCPPGVTGHLMLQRTEGPHPRPRVSQTFGPGATRCPVRLEGLPEGPYLLQANWLDTENQGHSQRQDLQIETGRITETAVGD